MKIKVLVYKRPNMFNVNNNLFHLIGTGTLERLFMEDNYIAEENCLKVFYPERFLNIIEQRALMYKAEKSGFKEIDIVTSSVYILQTVNSDNILIVDDKSITEENQDIKLSNDESGMPFDGGLNIL